MADGEMTGAEMVIKALVDQGVDVVFGYPGGAVLPIYDALFKQNSLRRMLRRAVTPSASLPGFAIRWPPTGPWRRSIRAIPTPTPWRRLAGFWLTAYRRATRFLAF